MARIPRSLKVIPGFALHMTWRAHNGEPNLKTDYEKLRYLEFMNKDLESKRYEKGAEIYAITLMTNHGHNMVQPTSPELYSNHMRRHHSRYGAFFNQHKGRTGKVAQDRPHTTLLADSSHEIEALCYIHANPVRANLVKNARDYRWSTHKYYAYGIYEDWMRNITFPKWYLDLGRTMALRQRAYRKIFSRYLKLRGTFPQKFLKQIFYGPILWKKRMEEAVSNWRKSHSPPSPSD